MRHTIEVVSLIPKPVSTTSPEPRIIFAYKNDNKFEQMELGASMMDVMKMFSIQNLSDAIGKKYDMEMGDDLKIISMSPIDTREIMYSDFERLEKKVNELITLMRKIPAPNQP